MSIEEKIDGLTVTLMSLTDALNKLGAMLPGSQIVPPAAVLSSAPPAPAAAAPVQPAFAPPPAAPAFPPAQAPVAAPAFAPAMPAPPSFAPAPAAPAALPFSDLNGLAKWATEMYHEIEKAAPGNGMRIQSVLTSLGANGMGDIKPEQFQAFFNGVNALRG